MASILEHNDPHRALFPAFYRPELPKVAKMRLILAIPTTGRPGILADTLRDIARQSRRPDFVVLSVSGPGDFDENCLGGLPFPCMVVSGEKGLTCQRNRALAVLAPDDVLLLLDDDFLMAPDYLAQTERLFEENPDVAMATGTVLADGICGPGFGFLEGLEYLAADGLVEHGGMEEAYNGYGCNMALRARPVLDHQLRFDETLPLYGWLEDVDFSRRLAKYGRIVRAGALRGVHLGTKTGRTPGVKLGYSQVVNPAYLIGKGTMAPRRALRLMGRNLVANLVKSLRPEPWVDRRGRLKGNLLGLRDLILHRARPGRISDLD